jgi:hypothetical protein
MNDADLEGIELENIIVGHRRTRPTQRFTPPPNDGPFIDDVDPAPIVQLVMDLGPLISIPLPI